jgi:hypothetical protein
MERVDAGGRLRIGTTPISLFGTILHQFYRKLVLFHQISLFGHQTIQTSLFYYEHSFWPKKNQGQLAVLTIAPARLTLCHFSSIV